MKDNEECEKWLNVEIPQNVIQPEQLMKNHHLQQNVFHQSSPNQPIHGMSGMYEDDPSFHHQYSTMSSSPVSGFSLLSESSNSSSLPSDGFPGFHETSPRFEETKVPQTPNRNTHYSNGFGLESKLPNTPMGTDELGLSGLLSGMNIRDGQDDLTINGHLPNNGFQFNDRSSMMTTNNGNVDNRRIPSYYHVSPMNFDEEMRAASMMTNNGNVDNRGIQSSYPVSPMNFDEEMRAAFLDLQEIFQFADLSEGYTYDNGVYPYLDDYTCSMRTPLKEAMENFRVDQILKEDMQFQSDAVSFQNLNNRRIQEQILYSDQNGTYCNKVRGVLDLPCSPQLTNTNLSLGFGGRLLHTPPMSNRRPEITSNGRFLHSPSSVSSAGGLEVSSGEDSLIIQGQSSKNYVYNKSCDLSREHKKHSFNEICTGNHSASSSQLDCLSHSGGIPFANCEYSRSPKIYHPHLGQPKCKSSGEVQGCIYLLAKHQQGCRLLQQKFDKRNPQYVNMIFNGIINHVSELMMDPFGNYLMQKLLDVCTEGQRTDILLMITREPDELVRISLNTHGTRVVQKLIQTLKTRQQISQVIVALEFGFIDLIKDLNGNHVVQSCLNSLSSEDNKFIFSAAAKFCLEIATHQHGCCVLQRCIDHSTGEHRENLVAKIAANGLLLAQDAYGNYVVQYIIGRKIPYVTKTLVSQFQGKYVHLSMQKYSSNVVEKCLKEFNEENRFKIIRELFSDPRFDQLLQHQFANYVVQTAVVVSKGALHSSLVGAILPHEERLKNNIYSKKLFSRSRLVK